MSYWPLWPLEQSFACLRSLHGSFVHAGTFTVESAIPSRLPLVVIAKV